MAARDVEGNFLGNYIILGMLGFYAVEDMKKKKITIHYLPVFAAIGIFMHLYYQNAGILSILGGMLQGMGILVLSLVTRESIGAGDGLILVVTGIYLGAGKNFELFMISLVYAAVFSLGLLVLGRKKRKYEIPFIPFLLAGYISIMMGVGG